MGIDHGRSVRREGITREQVAGVSRFLVVTLRRVREPAVLPSVKISQPEPALAPVTGHVDEHGTVWGQQGTHRAALRAGQVIFSAVTQVEPRYLPQGQPHVVGKSAVLARVIQVASVRRINGAERVLAIVCGGVGATLGLGDLHAASPIDVIGPQLEGPQSPLGARCDHVCAVGRPRRGRELDRPLVGGQLARFAAIRVCDPHVLAAVPVAHENDSLAVRREPRLRVERHAAGDAAGSAAFDGQDIQVSDRLHDDGRTVG